MKFYYHLLNVETGIYYDEKSIRKIKLIPATPEVEYESDHNERSDLWPIHNIHKNSCDPVDCKSEDEAYDYLLESVNFSEYEREHDL